MNIEYTKPTYDEVSAFALNKGLPLVAAKNQLSRQVKNQAINNKLSSLEEQLDHNGSDAVFDVLKEILVLLRQPTT